MLATILILALGGIYFAASIAWVVLRPGDGRRRTGERDDAVCR